MWSISETIEKKQFYYGWVIVAACFAVNLVSVGIRHSFGVFFKPLEADFGLSRAYTSGFYSVYLIMSGFIGIIGGWALDRYGPRKVFAVVGILASLSLLLTSLATAPWHIFISYSLVLAIGTGSTYAIVMALISKWFVEKQRGLALGIVSCGSGIGMIVVPPLSEYLISSFSWQSSYFILGLLTLCVMMPCALVLRENPAKAPFEPGYPDTSIAQFNGPRENVGPSPPTFTAAVKSYGFWVLFLAMFLWSLCSFIVMAHIVRHAIDLDISSGQAATVLVFIGATSIPGRLLIGRLSDVKGSRYASMIYALVMIAAMTWLIWASDLWGLYLFSVPFGLCFGAVAPLVAILIGDGFRTQHLHQLGTIFGFLEVGWAMGSALGPVLAGYIYDINEDYTLVFIIGIVAITVTILLIPSFNKPVIK